jgi:hypothetical protein
MYQTRKHVSMVLVVGTVGLLLMLSAKNSDALAEEKRQAQSTTTVCDEDTGSCEISVCDNKLLCETSSIPNPSDTEPLMGNDGEEKQSGEHAPNSEPDDDVPLGYIPWWME